MGIRVALHHKTLYEYYDRLVTLSPQIVRLRPAPHPGYAPAITCETPDKRCQLNRSMQHPSSHLTW
jgi:hypothetical protein